MRPKKSHPPKIDHRQFAVTRIISSNLAALLRFHLPVQASLISHLVAQGDQRDEALGSSGPRSSVKFGGKSEDFHLSNEKKTWLFVEYRGLYTALNEYYNKTIIRIPIFLQPV